ncbi:hypothetical protein Kpol_411p12 [Vanderwaltozyma polyspora DSM 70294]|uniref:LCCL domain-containing protein n=1 Tax=Vanderwaltozyma polyspora (strain ATCC 22028 / DSM 70294 / BCRC 21397 / CBS 2163 / NBRC 10782 / NRRL Y-8283 / UCD 57-17) TaxID=436907 RepID=A7TRP5_VANPO|nr:uncharacterized protein Kpol_411p12 [Vanderwaltozyma polyspora DSM 70294]EDO15067.1 hypothetical protein Kpol_411p12 [Vanderwaltozyma polyspora DSM 70294]
MNNSKSDTDQKSFDATYTENEFSSSIPLSELTSAGVTIVDGEDHREEWEMLKEGNSIKRFFHRVWNGPIEPKDEPPSFPMRWPWLKAIEEFPSKSFGKEFPSNTRDYIFLTLFCSIWLTILYSILHPYLFIGPYFYQNTGEQKIPIVHLACNSYMRNWRGKNNACGLNGANCSPFEDKEFFIRCPALCDQGGTLYSTTVVGGDRIKYQGYRIGGGKSDNKDDSGTLSYPYRADSFPCNAGVHAGVISPFVGGCAKVKMSGSQLSFPSRNGQHGTGFSISFDSFFPSSYTFADFKHGVATGCYDPRFLIAGINILFGGISFYFSKGLVGYWIVTIISHWTIILSMDPPLLIDPHDNTTAYELISIGFQRLLPLCFVLYVVWKFAVKRTLEDGSPVAKIILWYPTFWVGALNNITFDRLPIDRLYWKSIKEQAGAYTALTGLGCLILVSTIIQVYSLWKSGRFRKYFRIYIAMIGGVVFLALIPGLSLRLHHYIIGLLLLPGCATRGSSAYLFQGVLIGLVISGISRWDFASIEETDTQLLRNEAGASLIPPTFIFENSTSHMLSWNTTYEEYESEFAVAIDGYSLLLNDIEVYVGTNTTVDLDTIFAGEEISQMLQDSMDFHNGTTDLFLRIARASTKIPQEYHGDYSNPAKLKWPEGIWHDPKPGVS